MKLVAVLSAPLFVHTTKSQTKKGKFILNMNNYINTHFLKIGKAKNEYRSQMMAQIMQLPKLQKVAVRFTLYPGTKRITDQSNICCIHDKFFMDAVVWWNRLPDDNYLYHVESSYRFGHVDKDNPRVDIEIYEVT
jgi:hypothetical protein